MRSPWRRARSRLTRSPRFRLPRLVFFRVSGTRSKRARGPSRRATVRQTPATLTLSPRARSVQRVSRASRFPAAATLPVRSTIPVNIVEFEFYYKRDGGERKQRAPRRHLELVRRLLARPLLPGRRQTRRIPQP